VVLLLLVVAAASSGQPLAMELRATTGCVLMGGGGGGGARPRRPRGRRSRAPPAGGPMRAVAPLQAPSVGAQELNSGASGRDSSNTCARFTSVDVLKLVNYGEISVKLLEASERRKLAAIQMHGPTRMGAGHSLQV